MGGGGHEGKPLRSDRMTAPKNEHLSVGDEEEAHGDLLQTDATTCLKKLHQKSFFMASFIHESTFF